MRRLTFTLVVSLVIVVAIAAVASLWFYFESKTKSTSAQASATSTYQHLLTSNDAFAQATALAANGDYAGAASKYREALALAQTRSQAAQIEIKLAQALQNGGDLNGAIDVFQSIAKNKTYPNIMRAYGAQDLGLLYDQYGNASVMARTFGVEPFVSMATSSLPLSYRHLYEYSISLYPLADAELHVADYYATQLVRNKRGTIALPSDTVALFGRIIRARIKDADNDIPRIQSDSNEVAGLPDIYKRKAIVLGKLAEVGTVSTTTAQAAYRQALKSYAALGPGEDGYVRYYYAAYLSAMNAPDSGVQLVLAPFYTTGDYRGSTVAAFFAGERIDTLNQKQVLQRLASIDPKFKIYLVSLGWKTSDF